MQVDIVLRMDKPDIDLIDGLAHLQLSARRLGWSIAVHTDCPELVELIELAGLTHVLSVEVRR